MSDIEYVSIDKAELKRLQADSAELARMREPVDLAARMKAAGMMTVDEIIAGAPIDKFTAHAAVNDLEKFGQWLEMKRREYLSLQSRFTLDQREDDELYEWVLAHSAVFGEVHVNFKQAIAQAGQVPEGFVTVPVEPTEEQWVGLARDIMMWLDMSDKTAPALFRHLERLGRDIPQWLRDEPEMQGPGVPSKGTRVAIIYRAMLEDLPQGDSHE